ncbi:MAG: HAD-IIA family hydrolase [Candidatus Caldatribacteriaceae bacterium]
MASVLIGSFRVFLFDLDGVIYRGEEVIPYAPQLIRELRKRGKILRFITNNPRRSRREVWRKLCSFSIDVEPDEVMTTSWATAHYLKERGLVRSYVLGSDSLREELRQEGIVIDEMHPQVVVVGYDEDISFGAITRVVRLLERGTALVATNPDISFALPEGKIPATGSVVQVIESLTGEKATVIGKPSPYIFELLLRDIGDVERKEIVLVGDSLDTDILGAHQMGIRGILYTSGDILLPSFGDQRYPDAVITHLGEFVEKDLEPLRKKAVGAIVWNNMGQVLLVRRRDNHLWCLPTGTVEKGETEEEAVIREMREELGIEVELSGLRAVYQKDPALSLVKDGVLSHFVVFLFEGFFREGKITPCPEEILDWGFFSKDAFPSPFFALHEKWISDVGKN